MSRAITLDRLACVPLMVFFLSLSACGDATTEGQGLFTNISLNNSTTVVLTVDITGNPNNQDWPVTVVVNPGTARTVEYQRLGSNTVWTFEVSAPGFADVTRKCSATNSIIGTNEYGVIDMFVSTGSTVLTVLCAQGWDDVP